ncbi:centrosomal protein of 70 kDa-like [Gigantopelta aegis]|uniref:centrosomal protein of 70 kDa-like n=1 Tax=Gigantopelta aegis TaxID=1735272 RepID=UPI001B88851D|nr:centrosomal protein of 70 kDa-like [Gigantopelta aegis]
MPMREVLMMRPEDDCNDLSSFESEVREWEEVNHRLRQNGFPKVKLLHPEDVCISSGEVVCFDLATSESLRETLDSLMQGSDTSVVDKYQTKIKDLKIMLECSRSRVKELEKELQRSPVYSPEVNNPNYKRPASSTDPHSKKLELQCQEKDIQIDMLQRKIHKLVEEENKRRLRQNQVFQEFKKRTSRAHSVMDEKLLDVIDSYEQQVCCLQKELCQFKKGEHSVNDDFQHFDASNNMKGVIKSFEKQLCECRKKIHKLEDEKENLVLDLGGKPDLKEYRTATLRMKKLEKLLSLHNISIPGEKQHKDPFRLRKNYSTRAEELSCLPLDFCRHYLKEICIELSVDDVEQIIPCLQNLKDDAKHYRMYEKFCEHIHGIISSVQGHSRGKRPHPKRQPLSDSQLQYNLEIVDNWKQDIAALQELQRTLNSILTHLAPWAKIHFSEDHSVGQMAQLLDSLAFEERGIFRKKANSEPMSRTQMEHIVNHFQTLFDVPNIEGVFPRMNEIYTKLGEVYNVLHTLKNLLSLPEDVNSSSVVDAVGQLCESHNTTTTRQLQQLLQTDDLSGVIRRLDEHSQFFPAFKQIMVKLMEILDVDRIDQVIPAVRALKMLSS